MECLVWNVPNSEVTLGGTLDQGFRNTLAYLYNHLRASAFAPDDWEEPNQLKYLFRSSKWSREGAFELVDTTWDLLG